MPLSTTCEWASPGRYTVFGAGAIGGTVGAHMVRGGESVLFVDRDREHVQAMNDKGLTIRGFAETFTVPVEATTPDALPDRLDTVLLACKAPATEDAVRSFSDRLTNDGAVVSLRNGLNELTIGRIVGNARTVGAFVNFSADYLEPGLIHFAGRGAFVIGELDGSNTTRLQACGKRSATGATSSSPTTSGATSGASKPTARCSLQRR